MTAALIGIVASGAALYRVGAAGATWYVDDATCPGVGTGSLGDPFCKIQDAICAAGSGDTVSVAQGTYGESIRMRVNVDLVSQDGPALTTIDGTGEACTETDYCTKRTGQCSTVLFGSGHSPATLLDGFTITGGSGTIQTVNSWVAGGGIFVFSSPTIQNNIIANNDVTGPEDLYFGGGIFVVLGEPVITNNVISGNRVVPGKGSSKSPTVGYGAGIYVGFSSSPIITENTIQNNEAGDAAASDSVGGGGGIAIFPGNGSRPDVLIDRNLISDNTSSDLGGGVHVLGLVGSVADALVTNNVIVGNISFDGGGVYTAYTRTSLFNNTITNNGAKKGGGVLSGTGDPNLPVFITNNIIEGNQITDLGGDGGGIFTYAYDPNFVPTISFNDLFGNEKNQISGTLNDGSVIGSSGNISADPLYIDPNIRDFHLDPNSPVIDSAEAVSAPAVDFDSSPRGVDGDGTVNSPQAGDVDMGAYEAAPSCAPSAEICDNLDNDCDGTTDAFATACGVGECAAAGNCTAGTDDCTPGSPVAETCDNLDNDCDGTTDAYATVCGLGECAAAGNCTAGSDTCVPGSPVAESCDNLDNDCDGTTDAFATACGVGECAAIGSCTTGADSCVPGSPVAESCDNLDNDCDGTTDAFATACGVGECAAIGSCTAGADSCAPGSPVAESCDNLDNDCDGTTDAFATACGVGECAAAGSCTAGSDSCVPGSPVAEVCDGLDNNCDGLTDNGFPDSDGDGMNDCLDPDDDDDLTLDGLDCAPLDPSAWGVAGEVANFNIQINSPTTLSWDNQDLGPGTTYEILSGLLSRMAMLGNLGEAFCLDDTTNSSPYVDPRIEPAVGDGYFYIVRATNSCGGGTFGDPNRDVPRSQTACTGGIIDLDGDGSPSDIDCNDADPNVSPMALEACDNLDNNCDGTIDAFATICGLGECAASGTCNAGIDSCTPFAPTAEVCDNLDNDCDGTIDAFATACGVGECAAAGICAGGGDTCTPGTPVAEVCGDGLDNDCDGALDNGFPDSDGDLLMDCVDPDDDNDGVDDGLDCAPLDNTAFEFPSDVADLDATGTGPTDLTWTPQLLGSGTLYDVTTGVVGAIGSFDYSTGTCLTTTADGFTTDSGSNPPVGSLTYYLVKSRNTCAPGSYGTAGRDTSPACP